MIKAMLIIYGISGMDPYSVEYDSMKECTSSALQVLQQDSKLKVMCIPTRDKKQDAREDMSKMFDMFFSIVEKMKEKNNDYCQEKPFDENCPVPRLR